MDAVGQRARARLCKEMNLCLHLLNIDASDTTTMRMTMTTTATATTATTTTTTTTTTAAAATPDDRVTTVDRDSFSKASVF